MDKLQWIKDLVLAEQNMEDSGMVDLTATLDPSQQLGEATLEFMRDLKAAFTEVAASFNQLKSSPFGSVKIYGISKTAADFMLFRNGHKLIFSMRHPGLITVSLNSVGGPFIPGQNMAPSASPHEDVLKANLGAFGELRWTYNDAVINIDYLVRFYMTRFSRDSAK